ncbi:MAG: hypothetical protein ABIN24_05480, partial [Dyadobacter sp.]
MKAKSLIRSVVMMGCVAMAGWSCSSDDDATPVVVVPPAPTFDIAQKSTTLGNVLVDQKGKTLYFFTKDVNGTSACAGGCLDVWPIFSAATPKLDTGLVATDFGTITRADGKT